MIILVVVFALQSSPSYVCCSRLKNAQIISGRRTSTWLNTRWAVGWSRIFAYDGIALDASSDAHRELSYSVVIFTGCQASFGVATQAASRLMLSVSALDAPIYVACTTH